MAFSSCAFYRTPPGKSTRIRVAGQFGAAHLPCIVRQCPIAAGRFLTRRSDSHPNAQACALGPRGSTPWKNGLSAPLLPTPRSSASCAAVTLRARFTVFVCHGAHSRASQKNPAASSPRRATLITALRRDICCGSEPASGASHATDGKTLRREDCRPGHGPGRVASPHPEEGFSRAVERFAEQRVARRSLMEVRTNAAGLPNSNLTHYPNPGQAPERVMARSVRRCTMLGGPAFAEAAAGKEDMK
jgi:hypothetical protein